MFLLSMYFTAKQLTFILQFIIYNLGKCLPQNSTLCLHIDLHASHVSHKVDLVRRWWVIFNSVNLCLCPMFVRVHLYVSVMFTFLCLLLLCVSYSSYMWSLYMCFCVLVSGSLFPLSVFHPYLFIRWAFQRSST